MDQEEFFETVCKMRQAQKDYFKTRNIASLDKAKQLERTVDNEIIRRKEQKKIRDLFM